MKKKFVLFVGFLLVAQFFYGQTTFKTMFYNLLNFPSANPQNRAFVLREILNTYQPDLFMVCELETVVGANIILDQSLNFNEPFYSRAQFIPNQSSGAEIQQLIYYKTDKFTLENTQLLQTQVRDINHYTLKLKTTSYNDNPIRVEVYVAHLKSSTGSANEQERLNMVKRFTDDLENLDPDSFVIFAGDFNVYNANEPAYLELLDPTNAIVMIDPIDAPGSWSNNLIFQNLHTQSTRESSGPFGSGAGGGLDDRFDFIMVSQNMLNNNKFTFKPETYAAYGNNGNCFNLSINDPICDGTYNTALRTQLYNMSDHLPVVLDFESSENIILNTETIDQGTTGLQIKNTLVKNNLHIFSETNTTIEIFSMLGQKINSFNVLPNIKNIINLENLSSGIYLLIATNNNSAPIKIIKQ